MEQQNIPKWFADFAVKNANEHGVLAQEIAKAEARTARWTAGAVATGVTIMLGALTAAVAVLIAVLN